jgi:hypothetical protein
MFTNIVFAIIIKQNVGMKQTFIRTKPRLIQIECNITICQSVPHCTVKRICCAFTKRKFLNETNLILTCTTEGECKRFVVKSELWIGRAFRQKLKSLMDFMVKHDVVGSVRCWMYSVEWQKRGLPHAHILIRLYNKITSNEIDDVICAEIPDADVDKNLHEVVTKNMIHGPCGTLNPY